MQNSVNIPTRRVSRNENQLVIDSIVSAQQELGPSVPNGGFGWVIFLGTLFFQALIPSLLTSFGIFLSYLKLERITNEDYNPLLWDERFLYVPLYFIGTWTFFEPMSKRLVNASTWPRMVAVAATCVICAGLLFMWMGMTGVGIGGNFNYILAGILTGCGASLQMAQCDLLLAQYFISNRYTILYHLSQGVSYLGFAIVPIILSQHLEKDNLLHISLWYMCIILQGIIVNILFRKPEYLKAKQKINYDIIRSINNDDDEDILSKNAWELKIKMPNQPEAGQVPERLVKLSNNGNDKIEASSSGAESKSKNWVQFDEEKPSEEVKKNWETFDDDLSSSDEEICKLPAPTLQEELNEDNAAATSSPNLPKRTTLTYNLPTPLFSSEPVNNNVNYSYDDDFRPPIESQTVSPKASVMEKLEILKRPTFYKSLLMIVTTKFSYFVFYSLFPTFLLQRVQSMHMRDSCKFVGIVALGATFFSLFSYWINIDKKRRALALWFLCWNGAIGYFMITDSTTAMMFIIGALQVVVSIAALQHIGAPLMGINSKTELSREFSLISHLNGLAFFFFEFTNCSIVEIFRFMALLHFATGCIWFLNFLFKRFKALYR